MVAAPTSDDEDSLIAKGSERPAQLQVRFGIVAPSGLVASGRLGSSTECDWEAASKARRSPRPNPMPCGRPTSSGFPGDGDHPRPRLGRPVVHAASIGTFPLRSAEHVHAMLEGAGVRSPTAAYHALYEKWQPEFADYQAQLRLPENACGVAVEIDGLLEAVDLFDKPSTLHKLWPRLVRSYVVSALGPGVPRGK